MTKLGSGTPQDLQILIIDDSAEVRAALRLLLSQEQRVTAITEASALQETEELTARGKPHVIIIDLELPGLAAEHMRALRNASTGVAIIGMTSRSQASLALAAASDSVVDKMDGPVALLAALNGLVDSAGERASS